MDLYTPVHPHLTRFCRAISGNIADAEDLMNDTVLAALEGLPKLKDELAFKSYIFSIASNLNRMRFRRKKFSAGFNEPELACIADTSGNPEYAVDFTLIYEKMLQLPPKTSEALVLFFISDMSLEEIQKIQGGSLSGVKLRIKRGREKLLQQLSTPRQRVLACIMFSF